MTGRGAGASARLRILIVEDDRLIGFLLSEMLNDMGHTVCGVERSEDGGVDAAARLKPDLMIVDAHLVGGTGAAVMARVLRAGPMPHLFMSGMVGAPSANDAISLLKPFSQGALTRGIADSMARQPKA